MPLRLAHELIADGISIRMEGRDRRFSDYYLPALKRIGVLADYNRGRNRWELFIGLQGDLYFLPRQIEVLCLLDPSFDVKGLLPKLDPLFRRFCALTDSGNGAVERLSFLIGTLLQRGLKPHDYQVEAAFEIIGRRFMVLSDEQGLGKTLSLCLGVESLQAYPLLVVTKGAVKDEWKREIRQWLPTVKTQVLERRQHLDPAASIYITHYQNLKTYIDKVPGGFATVVFDESHELQSPGTQRVRHSLRLARAAYRVYLVTGTFTRAFPADLYSQLLLLRCPAANDRMDYLTRYCGGHFKEIPCRRSEATSRKEEKPTKKVFVADGVTNEAEFSEMISGYVLRRTKDEVGQLPKKNVTWIDYQVPWNHYYFEVQACFRRLPPKKRLGAMSTLVAEIAVAKTDETIRQVKLALNKHAKVVAFTGSIPAAAVLAKAFPEAILLSGGLTSRTRQQRLAAFNDPAGPRISIASNKASGAGLNLQVASSAFLNDLPYTSDELKQIVDRIHRLGQTRDCDIGIIRAPGTIDDVVMNILTGKMEFANALNQWCEANSSRTRGIAHLYV